MRQNPSPNYNDRRDVPGPDILVLHYTGMATGEAALARLCDPAAEVSAHYLIEEDGTVCRLVAEEKRAWHAGVSSWRGFTDINSRSIGIELVNPGHEFGYTPFPDVQIGSLTSLCQEILRRHPIPLRNVVGHSDVAPGRKQDPGELFPWAALARAGVGLWPEHDDDEMTPDADQALRCLGDIGYGLDAPQETVQAFQRRFLPDFMSGDLDQATCRRIAAVHQRFTKPD